MSREINAPGAIAAEGFVPLSEPNIGEAEADAVVKALRTGYVSSVGKAVDDFEARFAEKVGSTYAVACATGTAALHVALRLVGVKRGCDVVCSDFTFVGSANPIAYLDAAPVFVDSESSTWNLDPGIVADLIITRVKAGRPPKAVEVVHVLGQPANLYPILDVCRKYGIPVIEDAAESLGSGWENGSLAGVSTGVAGDIGCFSFNGNKVVTSGGGGMIVTDDADLAKRARHLTTQAKIPDIGYLHDEVGYNYRLTNLAAALGGAQLARLDEFVGAKRRIAARYDKAFIGQTPLVLPPRLPGYRASYWLYSVLTQDEAERDRLIQHLASARIGARALWRPLHLQPSFAGAEFVGGGVGASLFARGLSLPCSTQLRSTDQDRVIDAVLDFYAH